MRGRGNTGEDVARAFPGAEGVLHCFSKHCKSVHNALCDPGGKPPRPRPAEEENAVAIMWTMAERRSVMR